MRAPSREVKREIKTITNKYEIVAQSSTCEDATNVLSAYNDPDSDLSRSNFLLFQNSIQGHIRHLGYSVEYSSSCYFDVTEIVLTSDRSVRCYNIPNPDGLNNGTPVDLPYPLSDLDSRVSTMCIRHGSGWAGATNYTYFDITNPKHGNISVRVYPTDRAAYLDSTNFGCVVGNQDQTDAFCDWDGLFTADIAEDLRETAINPHIAEYDVDELGVTWHQTNAVLSLVVLDDVGPVVAAEEPLQVHPGWFRAACWQFTDAAFRRSDDSSPEVCFQSQSLGVQFGEPNLDARTRSYNCWLGYGTTAFVYLIFAAKRAQREPLDLVVTGLLQKPPNGFTAETSWKKV
ncbi:hypothetical protein DL768_007253 [Monosporascus sp. mg162]|nr:hypothetical protein DL768_007253 [Monosporascus sp. mg162]